MRISLLFAVLGATACATAPQAHDVKKYGTIHASADATWAAVIALFGEKGWPIETIDKGSGLISTKWLQGRAELADCGTAPLATVVATRGRFNLIVRPAPDGTRITINTTFRQVRSFADQSSVIECTSTGIVEAGIQRDIASIVAGTREAADAN